MNNLANSHHRRGDRLEILSDIDLAIWYYRQAMSIAREDEPGRPGMLMNLSSAFATRYLHTNQPQNLDRAIEYLQIGIALTDEGHMYRCGSLGNLGCFFLLRSRHSNSRSDIVYSLESYKLASQSVGSNPNLRSKTARRWASLCVRYQPQAALEAYQVFMSLIPQVIWLGLVVEQRCSHITEISGAALEAAGVAIKFQAYGQALEWVEQGRSIVWTQQLQLRSPLDDLQAVDPPLAAEMSRVAEQLQAISIVQSDPTNLAHDQEFKELTAQRYRRLVEDWEKLVQKAQSLPNSHNFLAPKQASQLMTAAQDRTLVIIFVTEDLCGAFIILPQATDVAWTPLDTLLYQNLVKAQQYLISRTDEVTRENRKPVWVPESVSEHDSILAMLWVGIAKPILNFLGYQEVRPESKLPHVTWCTMGPLSFLPLHAAGDYTKPHCTLFDYCVSSFTPTISALLAAPPDPATFTGIALVAQESTSVLPRLPGTTQELNMVSAQTNGVRTDRLDGASATCDAVMEAMEQHSWVHLACHASQDVSNPLESAFHLSDGSLALRTISGKRITNAHLAFLSACQTATGDMVLSDEAIHLAAGMLMAGYRTVIATMWPIGDQDAPIVAEKFYEYMLKDGIPDSKKAARALHHAVGVLREQVGVAAYRRWAPFIHIGI
ncbi:hypothetical protein FRC12_001927 [Ceratobasidium sp. 428]|nr:hypothetical protein FRC12_001927 [Ceratobasidium sp. 428]